MDIKIRTNQYINGIPTIPGWTAMSLFNLPKRAYFEIPFKTKDSAVSFITYFNKLKEQESELTSSDNR